MIVRTRQLKSEFLQKTSDTCETLFFYIRDGHIQKFEQLFEIHKDFIENKDKLGNTMLNYAVQNNMYDIVEYLIKNGADINTYNNDLNTPLHYALSFQYFTISDLLIKEGANEKALNIHGMTPWQCLKQPLDESSSEY